MDNGLKLQFSPQLRLSIRDVTCDSITGRMSHLPKRLLFEPEPLPYLQIFPHWHPHFHKCDAKDHSAVPRVGGEVSPQPAHLLGMMGVCHSVLLHN